VWEGVRQCVCLSLCLSESVCVGRCVTVCGEKVCTKVTHCVLSPSLFVTSLPHSLLPLTPLKRRHILSSQRCGNAYNCARCQIAAAHACAYLSLCVYVCVCVCVYACVRGGVRRRAR